MSHYLGMNISRDINAKAIFLNQSGYIDSLVEEFSVSLTNLHLLLHSLFHRISILLLLQLLFSLLLVLRSIIKLLSDLCCTLLLILVLTFFLLQHSWIVILNLPLKLNLLPLLKLSKKLLLLELGFPQSEPTVLFTDNTSTIKLLTDVSYHAKSKHIDVRFHFIRELFTMSVVVPEYLPTSDMPSDLLTKSLSYATFLRLRPSVLGPAT